MDWKDKLSALQGLMPEGEDNNASDKDNAAEKSESKAKKPALPKLNISFERKGRGGKTATIVAGFGDETSQEELEQIATKLKKQLGTGGSARGGEILIQGDRRQDVAALLRNMGYKVSL